MYNVSEKYIVTNTNKDYRSVDSKSTTEHDYTVSNEQMFGKEEISLSFSDFIRSINYSNIIGTLIKVQ